MKVSINGVAIHRGLFGLSVFAWDRQHNPTSLEAIVELDDGDLRAMGRRMTMIARTCKQEDPDYFVGEDMEGVPCPDSEEVFIQNPQLLNDYLCYSSFWRSEAGNALLDVVRDGDLEPPMYWVCNFIEALPNGEITVLRLGVAE